MSQSKDKPDNSGMNRRCFLKTAAGTATALALPFSPFPYFSRKSEASGLWDDPRVLIVRDTYAHSGSQVVADIAQVMMDESIRQYTGISDIGEAYRAVFPGITTDSIIGIKINAATPSLPPSPAPLEHSEQLLRLYGEFRGIEEPRLRRGDAQHEKSLRFDPDSVVSAWRLL